MSKHVYIIILLVVSMGLYAQTDEDWYFNIPIIDIQFEGLTNVSENDLQGIVEPFINGIFTDELLNEIQRRLYNLEYFDLLVPEAVPGNEARDELILKFTVEERPIISAIEFSGNRQLRRSTIFDEILLRVGDVPVQSKIRADQETLITLYRESGYPDVSISFQLEDSDTDNSQVLSFFITEGIQTNIRSIVFSGINFATENQLRALIISKQQGLFDSGVFQESNLELDRQAILNFYGESGYIDAQVLDIAQELVEDQTSERRFLRLTYFIDEGIPWIFGGINFSGNNIFSDDELRSRFFLEDGRVLNFSLLQQGFQAVSDLYFQGGYIFNQIQLEEERDEAQQQINFTVRITESGRAHIENIIIRGNTKTKDDVILRELQFEEGDVFSAGRIREGIANLYNTRFFADVPAIETPQGSVPGLMNLVINLEEGQTTDLRLGFSFAPDPEIPIAGIVRWGDSNFLGNGQTIEAELNISQYEQSIQFSFFDPWLFGDRWSGGIGINLSRNVQTQELQDIIHPIFHKDDPVIVPDPFQGYYVFSEAKTYNGREYEAGEPFPGVPKDDEIERYDLVTDYDFFRLKGGNNSDIASDYKMEYVQWTIAPRISTGLRIPTSVGWFGINSALSIGFNIVEYDENQNRPFEYSVRENLGVLRMINSLYLRLSMDGRDVIFNPQNGYYAEQAIGYVGGFLGGARNYIRTDTTLQGYLTLFNVDVSPEWSWKMVLAANISLSFLLEQFFVYEDSQPFEAAGSFLSTNSMNVARGWPLRTGGEALFNSWIELRMPLAERVVWFDIYAEAVRITENRDIFAPGSDNWLFGFGAGFRFTIQQFPFRIYLGKRFKIVNDQVEWQQGNIFKNDQADGTSGIDLIFAISIY
ncbi:MAG: outer membrane protein assembly factor BamA [Salinispira sp.]